MLPHLKRWLLQIQVGCIKILRTNVARFVLTKCWANGGMHVSGGKEPIFPDRPQPPRPQLTPSPLPGSAPSRRWKNWRFVFITSLGFSLNLSVSRITSHIYFGLGKILACTFCSQINMLARRKKIESLKRNTNSPKDGVQYNERPKFWHFYAQAYFKNVLLIWFSEFSCWKFDPRALENKGAMLQNGEHAGGW